MRTMWISALVGLGLASAARADPAPAPPTIDLGRCAWTTPAAESPTLICPSSPGQTILVRPPEGFGVDTPAKAQGGDAASMRLLGLLYRDGPVGIRNEARSVELLKAAAAQGEVRAKEELGITYRDGRGVRRDYQEAFRWFLDAAEQGDVHSMVWVGYAYSYGQGVMQDYGQALRWLRAAADQGSGNAMLNLGQLYFGGHGVDRDFVQAAHWFKLAADSGNPVADRALAYLYQQGLGEPKDPVEGDRLLKLATSMVAWSHLPDAIELQVVYPVDAAIRGLEGNAVLDCTVSSSRAPVDCRVMSETPGGFGFGEAGLSVAPAFKLAPGLPAGEDIQFNVAFRGPIKPADRPTADRCAAYATALGRMVQRMTPTGSWWARYWLALSDLYATRAGESDAPERLEPAVADAVQRLQRGRDRGLFGQLGRCYLTS